MLKTLFLDVCDRLLRTLPAELIVITGNTCVTIFGESNCIESNQSLHLALCVLHGRSTSSKRISTNNCIKALVYSHVDKFAGLSVVAVSVPHNQLNSVFVSCFCGRCGNIGEIIHAQNSGNINCTDWFLIITGARAIRNLIISAVRRRRSAARSANSYNHR